MPSSIAVSRPVNPAGLAPLTSAQLWAGLGIKAREPLKFVKQIVKSDVTFDDGGKVVRDVEFGNGMKMTETINIYEPTIAYFEGDNDANMRVTNLVSWLDGDLLLTFSFVNGVPGHPVIDDPKATALEIGKAIDHTLDVVRQLVKDGTIA